MRITGDREERILAAFHGLGGGLQTSEIKKMLPISDNENKQFILSLRRLGAGRQVIWREIEEVAGWL